VEYGGRTFPIAQTNNVYIFPGIGLGVLALAIPRVSDSMLMASSRALADAAPAAEGDAVPRLLPPLSDVRSVSRHIAIKVGLAARVDATVWQPIYRPYVAA
jgi:malate dehydrogenase (oxaloacetate-decarboxylating)